MLVRQPEVLTHAVHMQRDNDIQQYVGIVSAADNVWN